MMPGKKLDDTDMTLFKAVCMICILYESLVYNSLKRLGVKRCFLMVVFNFYFKVSSWLNLWPTGENV